MRIVKYKFRFLEYVILLSLELDGILFRFNNFIKFSVVLIIVKKSWKIILVYKLFLRGRSLEYLIIWRMIYMDSM